MPIDDDVEKQFNALLEEWKEYCISPDVAYSSDPYKGIDCEAYKKLVALGPRTLPLIRKLYDSDRAFNGIIFACLVHDIANSFGIPVVKKESIEEVKADSAPVMQLGGFACLNEREIHKYTIRWLDENIPKYAKEGAR